MQLLLDVGNTRTAVGLTQPGGLDLLGRWSYETAEPDGPEALDGLLRALLREKGHDPDRVTRLVVGSVVPDHDALLAGRLPLGSIDETLFLDGGADLPIRLDVEKPLEVGADRIANALAAHHRFSEDTVVVDLGTATTIDCVGGDGVFIGGVIAPGVRAGPAWLESRAAKLPSVELSPPPRVIGRNTRDALRSGIFHGAVDAVDGLVERVRLEWSRPDARVVTTGGYANLIAPHARTLNRVEPDLTLLGLALAGRYLGGDG